MALFYSKAQGGFFDDTIHDAIPADACAISTELHASLLERQSMGLCIVGDEDGRPVAVEPVPSDEERLRALRGRRDGLLRESDRTQMPDYPISEDQRTAWAIYRQALRDLPETVADLSAIEWPSAPSY